MMVTEEIDGNGLNNSRRTLFVPKEGYSSADVSIQSMNSFVISFSPSLSRKDV